MTPLPPREGLGEGDRVAFGDYSTPLWSPLRGGTVLRPMR